MRAVFILTASKEAGQKVTGAALVALLQLVWQRCARLQPRLEQVRSAAACGGGGWVLTVCGGASEQSPRTQGQGSAESAAQGQSAAINGI